jgi:hypothetical protein
MIKNSRGLLAVEEHKALLALGRRIDSFNKLGGDSYQALIMVVEKKVVRLAYFAHI